MISLKGNLTKSDGYRAIMRNFTGIADKLIVFICCLFIYLCQTVWNTGVVMILISVIFGGFLSYFDDEKLKAALTLVFTGLAFYIPELMIFMPVILFDMLFSRYRLISLFTLIPAVGFIQTAPLQLSAATLIILALALLVRFHLEAKQNLQLKLNELRDTTREMSIQMQKQNRDLIEKQDNELNLATLNERNRIAREIHDNVGHLLSSAILQSGALLAINKDDNVKKNLETLKDTLSQAMNSIRTSVHELYDESIDLNAQMEELVGKFTFCELRYEYMFSSNPSKQLKYALISIVKEALSNIMKHSNATAASIRFGEHPAFYQLIIRDNGTVLSAGMDEGLGLKNMADRVHSFGGNINIMTEKGFEIFITIPKEELKN